MTIEPINIPNKLGKPKSKRIKPTTQIEMKAGAHQIIPQEKKINPISDINEPNPLVTQLPRVITPEELEAKQIESAYIRAVAQEKRALRMDERVAAAGLYQDAIKAQIMLDKLGRRRITSKKPPKEGFSMKQMEQSYKRRGRDENGRRIILSSGVKDQWYLKLNKDSTTDMITFEIVGPYEMLPNHDAVFNEVFNILRLMHMEPYSDSVLEDVGRQIVSNGYSKVKVRIRAHKR